MSRLREVAKEVSALREEIVKGIPDAEEPTTLALTAEQMSVIIYSLAVGWLSEGISRLEGYEVVVELIGRVSSEIMSADLAPDIDKFIDSALGGIAEGDEDLGGEAA